MENLQVIEVKGQRVLTTKQIAEAYKADIRTVQQSFRNNKKNVQRDTKIISDGNIT